MEKVARREFDSPEAVISAALRTPRERDLEGHLTREDIHASIERGYQQSLRGEGSDGEQFVAGLEAEIDRFEQRHQERRPAAAARKRLQSFE